MPFLFDLVHIILETILSVLWKQHIVFSPLEEKGGLIVSKVHVYSVALYVDKSNWHIPFVTVLLLLPEKSYLPRFSHKLHYMSL